MSDFGPERKDLGLSATERQLGHEKRPIQERWTSSDPLKQEAADIKI